MPRRRSATPPSIAPCNSCPSKAGSSSNGAITSVARSRTSANDSAVPRKPRGNYGCGPSSNCRRSWSPGMQHLEQDDDLPGTAGPDATFEADLLAYDEALAAGSSAGVMTAPAETAAGEHIARA